MCKNINHIFPEFYDMCQEHSSEVFELLMVDYLAGVNDNMMTQIWYKAAFAIYNMHKCITRGGTGVGQGLPYVSMHMACHSLHLSLTWSSVYSHRDCTRSEAFEQSKIHIPCTKGIRVCAYLWKRAQAP